MTVREAISMSATLRIPMSVPDTEKAQRVEDIIKDLGLTKCADTIIGDVHKGRCAMAMEMVTNPKIMFLDEPTSVKRWSCTFTAFSVIQTLRNLAHHRGQTYIATIHQPSSQLFRLFDDLLLLSDGRVMYYGETKNAVPYFTQHHFKCPIRSNPADYFFYHVLNNQDGAAMPSSDRSSTEKIAVTEETNTERIIRMLDVWEKSAENEEVKRIVGNPTNGGIPPGTARYKAPLFAQLSFLFDRESKDAFRDPLVLQSRLVQTIFLSLIAGLLYYKNADLPENAMGALFFISVTNVFMSAQSHLSAFGKQKAVFIREYGAGYYGLWSFFVSKVGVELPMQVVFPWLQITIIYWMAGFEAKASKYFILTGITILSSISGFALGVCLACSFSSLPVALIAAPLILLPLMLFSGLFVNTSAMPVWILPFEAALKAVMDGTKAGDVLVSNLFGSSGLSVTGCCLLLLLLILFLIGLAYLNLYMLVKQSSKSAAKKK
ncbi:ABC-2 type transporter-domain-containing protein [Chytridium lagenaria]|nr:ABC-2 type transporter-domain-containing protein [Chytridium lagenaria]